MRRSEPRYLAAVASGVLAARVDRALDGLKACETCPRVCGVDRLEDRTDFCGTGRFARISSAFPHLGEENCLRGRDGSGTIFFASCSLKCVFCQNCDISWEANGTPASPEELATLMVQLQRKGCHNINFVTPGHVVPQILEALPHAVKQGFRIPLVYNTGAYDALKTLELLDGIVDIYMPDFKFWDPGTARRLADAEDYPETARRAIREMHRQTGDLVLDDDGLAVEGVLVRHLVMPNNLAGTREIMRLLARDLSPNTYVNLMAQYAPAGRVGRNLDYEDIDRHPTRDEIGEAHRAAREEGLHRFDNRG